MPAQYLAIKRRLMRDGMSEKEAEESAARIYNSARKKGQKPVTGKHKS